MLRFFIIAAEIIVLVIVLRSPFVQYLFEDIQNSVSDWLVSIATLPERKELRSLQDQINIELSPLKPYQQSYVKQITSDAASVKRFHHTYCENNDSDENRISLAFNINPVGKVGEFDSEYVYGP